MTNYLSYQGGATGLLPKQMSWDELLDYIRNLPYGRNANRHDLRLVLQEQKGTCSSKHALLKMIADENNIQEVDLILCMYKMNGANTQKIGKVLEKYSLEYIPEAHCYLSVSNQKMDLTNPSSDIARIEKDILEEIKISPEQVIKFKVDFHKDFMKRWIKESSIAFSFKELWNIREECIEALSNS